MTIETNVKWVRATSFQKYFASTFGITKSGSVIRLDFGNERIQFSKNDFANVSECQIIINYNDFDVFYNLIKKQYQKYKKMEASKEKKK